MTTHPGSAEEHVAPDEGAPLRTRLDSIRQKIGDLLATAEQGRILREGVRAVIYGPTNAGKSSLLNRLLGYDRAIVSRQPGTTRDTIEEVINLRGIPVRLLDTAGLRESADEVEREGMARTEKSLVAIAREKQIKKWNRGWKLKLIEEKNPEWRDLFNEICQ